jgi:hypothetical protein
MLHQLQTKLRRIFGLYYFFQGGSANITIETTNDLIFHRMERITQISSANGR